MIDRVADEPTVLLDAGFPDVDVLCDTVRLWDLDLRPLRIDPEKGLAGQVVQKLCAGGAYGYCGLNGSFDQFGSAPPGVFTFVVRKAGVGNIWWRSLDTVEGEVLVYKPGSEVRCVNGQGFAVHTISVDDLRLREICESLKIACPDPVTLPEVFRLPARVLEGVRAELESCLTGPTTALGASVQRLSELLVSTWVAQLQTRYRQRPNLRARDRAIRNCLEFLEQSDLASVDMQQLCNQANVSKRTLQYAFREKFQITPYAFLRSLRLSRVRKLLKQAPNRHTAIGELAASQGIWHHGRFSQDYRLAYGETPLQTRQRHLAR
ncbi:helix-turn-helix domain-containing protein [uncultured Shimia sp.]|uniref:AraC family transcriptional regulator n=1 Tax=uncultured Shimia sp. TaxID=573152 RepID=UPI00262EE59F|nr:helix-turn-helix domain-containing protein [uncultured Shimia sp.]